MKSGIKKLFIIFICCLLFSVPIKAEDGNTNANIVDPFTVVLNKTYIHYGDVLGDWYAINDSQDLVNTWIVWYCDGKEMTYYDRFIGGHCYSYNIYAECVDGKIFTFETLFRYSCPTVTFEYDPSWGGTGSEIINDHKAIIGAYEYYYYPYLDTVNINIDLSKYFNSKGILSSLPNSITDIYNNKVVCDGLKIYSIDKNDYEAGNNRWTEIAPTTDISKNYDTYYRLDYHFRGGSRAEEQFEPSRDYVITEDTVINLNTSYAEKLSSYSYKDTSSIIITKTQRAIHYYDKVEIPIEYSASQYKILDYNSVFYIDGKTLSYHDVVRNSSNTHPTKVNVDNNHIKWHFTYEMTLIDDYQLFKSNTKVYIDGKLVSAKISTDGKTMTIEYDTPSIYVNKSERTSLPEEGIETGKEEKIEENITNNAVLDNITLETNDEELIKEQNKPSPIGNGVKPDIELVRSTLATTQNSNSIEDFVQTHKEAIITGGCSLGLFIVYLFVQRLRRKQCN